MKFIVDRKTWYRGKDAAGSALLLKDGRRCCIGFVANQCGIPDNEILDIPTIHHALETEYSCHIPKDSRDKLPAWLNTDISVSEAYGVNDNPLISDTERETTLKQIFEENGDEIEFIN